VPFHHHRPASILQTLMMPGHHWHSYCKNTALKDFHWSQDLPRTGSAQENCGDGGNNNLPKRIIKDGMRLSIFLFVCLFSVISASSGTVPVSTVSQLVNAVATANSSGGNTTIVLQDGTYTLSDTLYINSPNVTVASASRIRENVIIQGDSMSSSAKVGNLIRVAASNFQIRDITLQKSGWHLIQIAGETNADSPIFRNCVFRDSYEQMLKGSVDLANTSIASDNGVVENCLFEYTAGIGPQYYIGGIDVLGGVNWLVRNNTFRNIISPSSSAAQFAVHFWTSSANNIIEKNLIINCDRGIGFGMDARPNTGGTIRNNMIYHSANKGQYADVGIAVTESPGSQVYNNTIFMENNYPWAIEYRFPSTANVLIVNNLTNKPIMSRDGATGTATRNVTAATATWFSNPVSGDLHLVSAPASVADAAQPVLGLTDDFDGQSRPQGNGFDIGADEILVTSSAPKPPSNLRPLEP
jgi:hypothetical protein